MEYIFALCSFIGLLLLGWIVGGSVERKHFAALDAGETHYRQMLVTQIKSFPCCDPAALHQGLEPRMICAEVVISSDYLKSYLGSWKKLFGGEIRGFQKLIERARREALLRLQQQATELGYNALCNVRLETADLAGRSQQHKKQLVMATLLATATAYVAYDHQTPSDGTAQQIG